MCPESAIASFAGSQMFLSNVTVSSCCVALSISRFSLYRGKAGFSLLRRFSRLSQNSSGRGGQRLNFSEKPLKYEDRRNLGAFKRN